jgi:hypothetical protein
MCASAVGRVFFLGEAPELSQVTWLLAALVLCCWPTVAASCHEIGESERVDMAADTTRVFPEVSGRNLEGREFQLPRDFEGDVNLVLIAFQREHQAIVDSWMPAAAAWAKSYSGLRYYELPTIASGYRLFRGFIDGGMRGGIPDVDARERTITLYLDKGAFRSALGLASEETVYALVIDAEGSVAHILEGPYSDAKGAIVQRVIERVLAVGHSEHDHRQAPN